MIEHSFQNGPDGVWGPLELFYSPLLEYPFPPHVSMTSVSCLLPFFTNITSALIVWNYNVHVQ